MFPGFIDIHFGGSTYDGTVDVTWAGRSAAKFAPPLAHHLPVSRRLIKLFLYKNRKQKKKVPHFRITSRRPLFSYNQRGAQVQNTYESDPRI